MLHLAAAATRDVRLVENVSCLKALTELNLRRNCIEQVQECAHQKVASVVVRGMVVLKC